MTFFSQQLSPEKWGIYSEAGLLATVSCKATCDTILANLKTGRRDIPTSELNSLYQVPQLREKSVALKPGVSRQSPSTLTQSKKRKRAAKAVQPKAARRQAAQKKGQPISTEAVSAQKVNPQVSSQKQRRVTVAGTVPTATDIIAASGSAKQRA